MSNLPEQFQLDILSHRRVLNEIRMNGEISGANIARNLKLQPSTLVYILRALKKKKLVEVSRIGQQEATAGKPPTLWKLVNKAGFFIGAEVIQNEMRMSVLDFTGQICFQYIDNGNPMQPAEIAPAISRFLMEGLQKAGIRTEQVIGAGIALTGLVDRKKGIVRYSRKLDLYDFALYDALSAHLNFPIELVNDANAGALGIKWHLEGIGTHYKNAVFLTLNEKNSDIGAGLVLNNRLYEGAYGTAGEIFTNFPRLHQLIDNEKRAGNTDEIVTLKNPTLKDVIDRADKGCQSSLSILNIYCQIIQQEILRIVEFINPNIIVIGGDIADANKVIGDQIRSNVQNELANLFPIGVPAPKILFSDKGIYAVSLGATALILRKIFLMETE